jgi:hypothetical protein
VPSTWVRRLVPVLGLACLVAACTPTKPSPPPIPPGALIAYYYSADNFALTGPFRSQAPHSRILFDGASMPTDGRAAQDLLPDGSVALAAEGKAAPNAVEVGFWLVPVRLGDIGTINVATTPGSDAVTVDLLLDRNGDGEFGTWDANGNRTSENPDSQAIGQSEAPNHTVDDASSFFANGIGMTTLGNLKAGAHAGITPDTRVAILVLLDTTGELEGQAFVTSVRINGVDVLVP